MRIRRFVLSAVGAVLALMAWRAASRAEAAEIEVWTPETGQVQIDALPRDTPEAKRQHALALIGAGQWAGGIHLLRELIAAEPDADWVPGARLTIVRGLLSGGQGAEAFQELEAFAGQYAGSPLVAQVRPLQLVAARVEAQTDADAALLLYDRLVDSAETREEGAEVQKEKGDVFFNEGRYLDAQAEYLGLIQNFPRSDWVPYCWYMVAECEWELAGRLKLGLERAEMAERQFRDFITLYPDDTHVPQARQKLDEARSDRADINWRIVLFYTDVMDKPWAAVGYLEYIVKQFPGTPQAEWAAEELTRLKQELPAPLRGEVRQLELPGVTRAVPAQ